MPGEIQTLPVPPNVSIATLLNAIRLAVGTGGGGGGTGDVTGPSSAVSGNVAVFSGTTGKVITDGGTLGTAAFLNATAQSQASTVLQRNANQNTFANNFISAYTTVTSAAGTTVLTAASAHILELTGTTTQTFQLPNATTLTAGSMWQINNNSTGVLTITNNGGTTLTTVPAGGKIIIQATSVATANGTWDYHFSLSSEMSCSDTSLILGGKTFSWSNSLILAGTDGSTLNIGAGGTLGTAAFTAASAYVPAASVTGGGVLATGGFTLTVPATGTAALLGTANSFTAAQTITAGTNSATPASGLTVQNTTAAIAGTQSASPSFFLTGQGWKTTATAASQAVDFRQYVLPVQGTTAPTGQWVLSSRINGGSFTDVITVDSTGTTVIGSSSQNGVSTLSLVSTNGTGTFTVGGGALLTYSSAINTTGNLGCLGGTFQIGNASAVYLVSDAANVLAIKNSTNAQTLRVYGTTTGSKYLTLAHNGTNATISASSGSVLISSLPTANPGPGILWNNAGTPAIGT